MKILIACSILLWIPFCAFTDISNRDQHIRKAELPGVAKKVCPETQREVWQISSGSSSSVACYFERQAFTSDDKYLVFSSDVSGDWKLYRLDLMNSGIFPVTPQHRKIHDDDYTMHPDGIHVCFMDQWILYAVNVYDFSEKILFDFTGKIPAMPRFSGSFTNDGIYTLLTTEQENVKSIYRINLKSGEIRIVHTQDSGSISHPLINPVYPDIISFVPGPDRQNDMNIPMELRARTWKTDLGRNETRQFLTCGYGFRATHESWAYNGTRFFYFRKSAPGWKPVAVCSMLLDGTDFKLHYSNDSLKLGHGVASRDGEWFVSDTQDPGKNPLVLINLKAGTGKIIAWPNSSMKEGRGLFSHVHPFFSPSARYICYTTDASGYPEVHVVPVGDIVTCY